eukprot:TRINITY_DN29411_c0_g2_i1.p1 TRINITY_DN29411_c0_g2~~TRINITY_DN29411_c0_g2_i1.p1  ORF type:complete len:1424 (+),score=184.70 TRINITY_DN29411_c0_g2_i1:502-4272(+)
MLGLGGSNVESENAGLLPRFLREIFVTHAGDAKKHSMRYTCEFYEIYNEQIRDLLAPNRTDRNRKVHVHPLHGVRIDGLSVSVVNSCEEALELLHFGNQMRTVAATTMNERSSRSHAIFSFKFEHPTEEGPGQRSTVTFVDLAGREDQEASKNSNSDQTFNEMCYINTSLFHLTHLIMKLSDGKVQSNSLADFRNSKLTLCLSPALIGNSRTLLIGTIAPPRAYFEDSLSTMNFAQAAKKIKTAPVVSAKSVQTVVKELEKELVNMRKELSQEKNQKIDLDHELLAAQALILHYKQAWEERVSESKDLIRARALTVKKLGLSHLESSKSGHPTLPSGQFVPFFTKLTDDDALQGCCNYLLSAGTKMVVGSDDEVCDVVLQGLGIRHQMCKVTLIIPDEVLVELSEHEEQEEPRVLVNGKMLGAELNEVKMSNGDCIVFGYAHAFRLVLPPEDWSVPTSITTGALARELVSTLDMHSAVFSVQDGSDSQEMKRVMPYIQQLGSSLDEYSVEIFLQAVQRICPLIDEANTITREVLSSDIVLELLALTYFMDLSRNVPELVVCVTQSYSLKRKNSSASSFLRSFGRRATMEISVGKQKHPMVHDLGVAEQMKFNGGPDSLLYVWSMEKFLVRLKEMRELYQEGCDMNDNFATVKDKIASMPYLNPWREVTLGDVNDIVKGLNKQHTIFSKMAETGPRTPIVTAKPTISSTSDATFNEAQVAASSTTSPFASTAGALSPRGSGTAASEQCKVNGGHITASSGFLTSAVETVLAKVRASKEDTIPCADNNGAAPHVVNDVLSTDVPETTARTLRDERATGERCLPCAVTKLPLAGCATGVAGSNTMSNGGPGSMDSSPLASLEGSPIPVSSRIRPSCVSGEPVGFVVPGVNSAPSSSSPSLVPPKRLALCTVQSPFRTVDNVVMRDPTPVVGDVLCGRSPSGRISLSSACTGVADGQSSGCMGALSQGDLLSPSFSAHPGRLVHQDINAIRSELQLRRSDSGQQTDHLHSLLNRLESLLANLTSAMSASLASDCTTAMASAPIAFSPGATTPLGVTPGRSRVTSPQHRHSASVNMVATMPQMVTSLPPGAFMLPHAQAVPVPVAGAGPLSQKAMAILPQQAALKTMPSSGSRGRVRASISPRPVPLVAVPVASSPGSIPVSSSGLGVATVQQRSPFVSPRNAVVTLSATSCPSSPPQNAIVDFSFSGAMPRPGSPRCSSPKLSLGTSPSRAGAFSPTLAPTCSPMKRSPSLIETIQGSSS